MKKYPVQKTQSPFDPLPLALQQRGNVPFLFDMGDILCLDEQQRLIRTRQPFCLTPDQISVHMAVLGGSGSGKSKFLEGLMRQMLLQGYPFCLICPHGDLSSSALAFVAAQKLEGDDTLWRKVHYLDLTVDCVFAYDPAARAPKISEVGRYAYNQWLKTRVDRLCRNILRRVSEANQEIMLRLKRWLKCVLYACLVAIDDQNTHVGLDKVLTFTDPLDEDFDKLFGLVREHLPKRVRRAFEKLIATRRAIDQEKWVESTINRLEDILSPLTESVFSQARPSIDIPQIIARREFLILNVKQSRYFSHDEKINIGGLIIDEVLIAKEAEEELPEDERVEFALVIDEIGEFLGEDLKRALGASRKYKNPLILAGQDLSTFAKGELDMAEKVLSMCGTVVCFQNTFKDDKDILGDRVGTGNLDFTRRKVEVQRQRGLLKLLTKSTSDTEGTGKTSQEGWSEVDSDSFAQMIGEALTLTETWSHSEGNTNSSSLSQNASRTNVSATGGSETRSPILKDGKVIDHTSVKSDQRSGSRAEQTSTARQEAHAHQASDTTGGSKAVGKNTAETRTTGKAIGKNGSKGTAKNRSHTEGLNETFVPNIVSEWEEDGQLEAGPIDVQKERMKQQLHTLGVAQAIVACRFFRRAFVAQIAEVKEWWATGRDKMEAVDRLKARLHALHSYYFKPSLRDAPLPRFSTNGHSTNGHATNGKQESNGHQKNGAADENAFGN